MQVIRDLQPDRHRMRLAVLLGGRNRNDAAGVLGYPHRHPARTDQREAPFHFSKGHNRTLLRARRKSAPDQRNRTPWNGRPGCDSIDPWKPVLFWRGAETKFHSMLNKPKCSATRRQMAA